MPATLSFVQEKDRLIINLKKITSKERKALEEMGFLEHDDFEERFAKGYTCEEAIKKSTESLKKKWQEVYE